MGSFKKAQVFVDAVPADGGGQRSVAKRASNGDGSNRFLITRKFCDAFMLHFPTTPTTLNRRVSWPGNSAALGFCPGRSKMKPACVQKHVSSSSQEKVAHTVDKSTSRASCHTQVKPLTGKVFYLDLPSNGKAAALENDIKQLGGTVEKFFSKEIRYLVSNKREARYVERLRHDSPVPSPDSEQSSPHPRLHPHQPGSQRDSLKGSSQGHTDSAIASRGKSLVEKVVKEQGRIQMHKILSNALEWGVKILYIDDVVAYVEKKKKNCIQQFSVPSAPVKKSAKVESTGRQSVHKRIQIGKPFVKVEDSSRHYRPVYRAMMTMPEFNLKLGLPRSPFYVEDKEHPGEKKEIHRGMKASANEERGHGKARKNKEKRGGGYCECCMLHYSSLTKHLQSECHKDFSRSDEYLVVDNVVSTLHCTFLSTKTKRRKYSIPSILVAPGLCRETKQRHKERDGDASETKGQCSRVLATSGCGEASEGPSSKYNPTHGTALVTHGEWGREIGGDNKGKPQPKHLSVSRKRPCWHDPCSACSCKAEPIQIHRPEAEMAPSRGDSFIPDPTLDQEGHRTCVDGNGSGLHNNKEDLWNEFPSNSLVVNSKRHEVSAESRDSLSIDCVCDGLPGKVTCVSQNQEADSPQSPSPVRTFTRKVRVYKQKRLRMETQPTGQEPAKLADIPGNAMLNLWQLFQSSDDMDLEFRGFED
ncbi:protein DBF4 homolog A [Lampris incognitus]|uniref:protein DBF4 homolog A n=1 Tax=Lampris incognitus TaxID=2546036 RepID=UPI0024B58783|nr:protein DBF4 homolog A [Lampris incognitus]